MKHIKLKSSGLALMAATGLTLAPSAFAGDPVRPHMPELLPHSSAPGQCYARVTIPAQYSDGSEGVMVEEGYTTAEVAQPVLQSRPEDVLVKERSVRFEVRQPTYSTQSHQMLVRPAYDKLTVTPPQFSTVNETIATSAPRLVWKRGNPMALRSQGYTIHSTADAGPSGRGYAPNTQYRGSSDCGSTCEIWCLVEEPGESATFQRKVMTSGGDVRRVPVPPKFKTIQKQVVSDPGGVREIEVPAEYRTVMVEDIVDPGGVRDVVVPPKYGSVRTRTLVSPERTEWRQVVCKPGTGSIRSGADYNTSHSSGHQSSGHQSSGYQSSGHQSYGHSSSYGSAGTTGHSGSTYSSGHSAGQTSGATGYYGTENYPAYGSGHSGQTHSTHQGTHHSGGGHTSSHQPRVYGNPYGQ